MTLKADQEFIARTGIYDQVSSPHIEGVAIKFEEMKSIGGRARNQMNAIKQVIQEAWTIENAGHMIIDTSQHISWFIEYTMFEETPILSLHKFKDGKAVPLSRYQRLYALDGAWYEIDGDIGVYMMLPPVGYEP
jgi:hypothetical protein